MRIHSWFHNILYSTDFNVTDEFIDEFRNVIITKSRKQLHENMNSLLWILTYDSRYSPSYLNSNDDLTWKFTASVCMSLARPGNSDRFLWSWIHTTSRWYAAFYDLWIQIWIHAYREYPEIIPEIMGTTGKVLAAWQVRVGPAAPAAAAADAASGRHAWAAVMFHWVK